MRSNSPLFVSGGVGGRARWLDEFTAVLTEGLKCPFEGVPLHGGGSLWEGTAAKGLIFSLTLKIHGAPQF